MRFFVCLLNPAGTPISQEECRIYESLPRSRGLQFQWDGSGPLLMMSAGDEPDGPPLLSRSGNSLAVGIVRLDNRTDLERWAGAGRRPTDLELVASLVDRSGTKHIPDILGDFAFVVWNPTTHSAVAACDAFAKKKLFHVHRSGTYAFASRGEALALSEEYDVQYLAEVVAYSDLSPGNSVYAGVQTLPPGTLATLEEGRLATRRYWSAFNVKAEGERLRSETETVEMCRDLLAAAVGARLTHEPGSWAQLSGGMDSSSVVAIAQWLAQKETAKSGLVGTISYVDTHGTGADEREYSSAVARQFQLVNENLIDYSIWQEDDLGPPLLDEPSPTFPFYARERRLCEIVRHNGCRTLLTGQGGDQLFAGNMFFFADWIAAGQVGTTVREMIRRAALGRVSFWELAYRNAVLPLLPAAVQRHLMEEEGQVPPWLQAATAQRYDLFRRANAARSYAGRWGHKYADARAAAVAATPFSLPRGVMDDLLDVQHPYLYRPLVEFALTLPPEMCVRPYERKWILRQAMRGLLPDIVRTRVGKGVMFGLLAWSVVKHRALLEALLRDPILAQLGVVDAATLRACFTASLYERDRRKKLYADMHYTLAIEAWLQVRSGRWPCESTNRH